MPASSSFGSGARPCQVGVWNWLPAVVIGVDRGGVICLKVVDDCIRNRFRSHQGSRLPDSVEPYGSDNNRADHHVLDGITEFELSTPAGNTGNDQRSQ